MSRELPICLDILEMRKEIPVKIAELSYANEERAIHYLRLWAEKKLAISEIHEQLSKSIQEEAVAVASS